MTTQPYNTGQQVPGQNGHWYYPGDGTAIWVPDTSAAGNYKGQGTGAQQPGHWAPDPNNPNAMIYVLDSGMGGSGPGAPAPATGGPTPPPPPSNNPAGGGHPTYTPGISFGAGVIPGQGDNYQRQWFNIGPNAGVGAANSNEGLNQTYYDDPGNWNYAWDKVLNQFGGVPGGDFYKFLQSFSNTARGDFQNTVPYDPNLHVANFLDQYAPQIKGVFGLLPSSQAHGGTGGTAGRSTY